MKKRFFIKLFHTIFFILVGMGYDLRWHTIKELEKKHLKKKYSRIQTAHIKVIGIVAFFRICDILLTMKTASQGSISWDTKKYLARRYL